jgi:hypothetical protein
MKYRLITLIVFLSMVLASCSLAEDITPPPGYQSPTSLPVTGPATPTQEPTRVAVSGTATPGSTPTGTQSPNLGVDDKATPVAALGNISGKLVNGSGSGVPEGQRVTLEGFDLDQAGTYQKTMELGAPVNPDGSYGFIGVEVPLNRAFLIITSWQGVEYPSDPIFVKDATTNFSIPITIYDKTDNLDNLNFDQVHSSFVLTSPKVIQVTEIFIVSNPGKQAVVVPTDGTTIPFIQVPAAASNVQYQLSQGSAPLMNARGGFAMPPGANKQYGFIANFDMPYNNSIKFEQPFSLPVSSLTVFVPQGMRLRAEQLTSAGLQDIQGQTYQVYQANKMASGSSLSLTISGKPETSTGSSTDRKTWVLVGIGTVGILLIGLGIYLYLRDRTRAIMEENELNGKQTEEKNEENALGENRENIMDAIIALDDQYKAGEIPKEGYEKRRLELKRRLKRIL